MRPTIVILPAMVAASCAVSRAPRTRPDDMTARDHRAAARAHEDVAREAPFVRKRDGRWWSYYWDSGREHLRERDAHLGAAETLEARYRVACDGLPIAAESTSPFERYAIAHENVKNGVVVRLAPEAGPTDAILAEIRCHWSWLQLEPRAGAANDLVAIDGLIYEAVMRDESLEVTVTAEDTGAAAELQRRAALLE